MVSPLKVLMEDQVKSLCQKGINAKYIQDNFDNLLITVCAVIVLVYLVVKAYNTMILNAFNGIFLLLLVLNTVLLLIYFTESNLATQVTLLVPLIIVRVVCLLMHRSTIKR